MYSLSRNHEHCIISLKSASFVILLVFSVILQVNSEPFTAGLSAFGAAGLAAFYTVADRLWCNFKECCTEKYIPANITSLSMDLQQKVYGQHLVQTVVLNTIQGHVTNPNPTKSLVLSFHGWTGGGKNFVSRIIADNIYMNGMDSKYVHLFVATLHFPHKKDIDHYKDQLISWIKGNVTQCQRQLFIFDEMDKMHPGLIDVLKPFLDHYPEIDGVDYRKNIFIFLSNTAGNDITVKTLENWKQGHDRKDITVKEMDQLLNVNAFNEAGGLWHSNLIEKHLIDFFVPFLPLERQHIKECIKDDLKEKRLVEKIQRRLGQSEIDSVITEIANELQYFPDEHKVYSKSGCKRVSQKVDLVVGEMLGFLQLRNTL
ncbi:torsin-1A-like [Saccoglossus kowalevskii]|uniref:Torsin-1B-like n=1 Tax=Saccoglossus kowalevskii TaxID=10224 RepID=A0ABM0H1M1_SACKO|nr:PREDICTED: torsin-1B-like [Saccoglossus kowalevskii]